MRRKHVVDVREEDTFADEAVGWALAAAGFYFQYRLKCYTSCLEISRAPLAVLWQCPAHRPPPHPRSLRLGFSPPWLVQLALWPVGVAESTIAYSVFSK